MTSEPVRRRHVLHLGGYEPVDPAGLRARLAREFTKHAKHAGLPLTIGEVEEDANGPAARWTMVAGDGPGAVTVTWEILRWDDMVRREADEPWLRLFLRTMATFGAGLANGVIWRLFRSRGRFAVAYVYQFLSFFAAVALPVLAGIVCAMALSRLTPMPRLAAAFFGAVLAAAAGHVTLRFARQRAVMQMSAAWNWAHDWARGRRPDFDRRLEAFARRVIAAHRSDADEIVVIGHSCGAVATIPMLARAVLDEPGLATARDGEPRLVLLNLGSALPVLLFHPAAGFAREAVARLYATAPLGWVEVTALKDPLGAYRFDPAGAAGLRAKPDHPLLWGVHLRRMMGAERYRRHRLDFIRLHYRYLTANDAPYGYDFAAMMLGTERLMPQGRRAIAARR